ncbi:MAG: 2-C-methyl-D-erythritol 4-phosphate cytidylyltransferase, partial [Desulfobulbaceae bacterium]|nr:2-C-methyl-D-erythritol 4-phosphate cytidylyltransferase [Desulfobulbaceae bacterium]
MNHSPMPLSAGVIIPAAGSGSRMGADVPKQFLTLAGEMILHRTIARFLQLKEISTVAVAVAPDLLEKTKISLAARFPAASPARLLVTAGGATRQESVRAGLAALPPDVEVVLVHDGARPLVDKGVILRCLIAIGEHGAVIAALPVYDTVKRVDLDGVIVDTVDRVGLWRAQTPQGARRDLLEQAFARASADNFSGTDEASLLEHCNIPVAVAAGSEENIKITRPEDLDFAEKILSRRESMRIGHGYDAHRLVQERDLVLGGVHMDYHLGLAGHSDADVLTHAFMDALLGAMGKGDIGGHFPDNDQSYKGISSLKLLEHVVGLLKEQGQRLLNADITVVCQRPK